MSSECVKVMVRARPINQREINEGNRVCIQVDKRVNQVLISKAPGEEKAFTYDAVYDWNSNQRTVYDESAFPLVESVLEGYNGTIFAYGQTGCGKTHTMMGLKDAGPEERGIIPNAFDHIFGFIDQCPNNGGTMKFLVRCSYLEIYNEDIRDLLNSKAQHDSQKLELKEDPNKGGVYVKDLTCCIVKSIPEIEKLMNYGSSQRKVGETAMNKDSSRSHSIFTIYIETSEQIADGESRIKAGKLNLVDLAGSERQSKTQAQGIRLKEATKINLSLSALGNVISALVDGKSQHIPYRDSKLTRLLQDSLGGNTKTVMIAAISPSDFNYEETLSTLRYAARAKSIQNKPRVNEDPKDALLKQYEEEIKKLKQLLEQNKGSGANAMISLQNAQIARREENIVTAKNIENQEESVDQLLEKLAKKGKRVKIINEEDGGAEQVDEGESPQVKIVGRKSTRKSVRVHQQENITEAADGEEDEEVEQTVKQSKIKKKSNRTIIRDSNEQRQPVNQQQQQPQQPIDITAALNDSSLSKDQLQQLIKDMEQRLVVGGSNSNVVENQEDKERIRQQRALQIKLRNEKKKQKALLEEKQKQEEELLLKQQQYSSLQEETEQNRKILAQLRSKYKQVANELKDVREENEEEKQILLETVREQEREIEFLGIVVKALLKEVELQNLREKSRYDETNSRWVVPVFYVKDKAIQLPRVGIRNAEALIQSELDKRDMIVMEGQNTSDNNNSDYEEATRATQQHYYGVQQRSQRANMDETYYNGATNNSMLARKTNQGFNRGGLNGGSVTEKMRQSRMSMGYDPQMSNERATPLMTGGRVNQSLGKFKQAPNLRQYTDSQGPEPQYAVGGQAFQTITGSAGLLNSESDISLNKKNMKSNIHLQPLNYKTSLPQMAQQPSSVAQGLEEILKQHHLYVPGNSGTESGMLGQYPQKISQLGKINNGGPHQIHVNLNPSESTSTMNGNGNGSSTFQMSIQATLSIDQGTFAQAASQQPNLVAPRRPQLAPIGGNSPPQHLGLKPTGSFINENQGSSVPQVRITGPSNAGNGQTMRKNRIILSSVNQGAGNAANQ